MTLIQIEDFNGRRQYVSAGAIAQITEAGASSQWHGIRSIVRLFDGRVIESRDSADELAAAINAAQRDGVGDEDVQP